MSKYTESPWLYSQNTVSGSNGSEMVAEVYGFDTLEKKANGKLIAAAPDLLEACQEFLKVINRTPTALEHYGSAIMLAEAAILKAVQL